MYTTGLGMPSFPLTSCHVSKGPLEFSSPSPLRPSVNYTQQDLKGKRKVLDEKANTHGRALTFFLTEGHKDFGY